MSGVPHIENRQSLHKLTHFGTGNIVFGKNRLGGKGSPKRVGSGKRENGVSMENTGDRPHHPDSLKGIWQRTKSGSVED
ncbi:hypothetical protein [Oxynema aestuarii]|uniref:Uncharacterized protein n=1 Tax=Oxynema aestuarii AP17 TaxID=2064643 RepID=A0A6H1U4K2_9CYAN|nr:hypothetical protein [Oxynema aestuarii]QIZ73080.1 hypothetical protein HCG48_22800 [Oxynema aestuarii AP17]